jgi:hypothetical protein
MNKYRLTCMYNYVYNFTCVFVCTSCAIKICLRCFKLRLNRKLYVKRHADKLNVGDLFLQVLKCFSCLSEGRAKEIKKEVDCIGVCIFLEIFTSCYMYVFMSQ